MYIDGRRAVLAGIAGIILTVIIGFVITAVGLSEIEAPFCRTVSDVLQPLLPLTGFVGRYCGVPLWLFVSVVLILIPRTRNTGLALLIVILLTLFFGDVLIKYLVERPRPYVVLDTDPLVDISTRFSYPSVHTALSFAAFSVFYAIKSKWAPVVLVFGIIVGISRIAVLAHFPSDVIMGAVLGIVVGSVFMFLLDSHPALITSSRFSCDYKDRFRVQIITGAAGMKRIQIPI